MIQSSKAEQFAEMVSHQENQIKLAFICISLILTMYLNIRFIIVDINLLGLSITSFITVLIASYSHFQRRNIDYFIHFSLTLLNLGILLIGFTNQTLAVLFDNEFTSRILLLVFLIGLIQMMTTSSPNSPFLKIISNFNMIFAYFVFLAPFGLSFQFTLFFAVTLFSLLTPKSYFNLFFASLFPWTLVYNLGYGIIILGETSGITIISVPITIGLIWEWLLCVYYPDWHGTKLKKIIGFAAIYTTIFTYLNLLFEYPVVMQPVTPFVLTIMLFVLIRLKQLLPHRVQSLNYLVILDVFLLTFTVTAYYLFITMIYRYFLAVSLSLSLSGFAFLYVIKQLKMVSQKSGIIANLSLGTISSGVFTFFLLIEPTLLNLSFDLAFPIAADLTVLAFFLAIGIYQHGFTRNIWASGWWMWNVVPLVNFTLIARLVSGVDYVTRTLRILNTDIQGSYILTIIICSFMYLPVIIYKIKNYLNQVIYIFWGELLALTIWGAVNLFPDNLSTQITFVFLIALVLLAPVFYYYKKWKQLFIIWPMLAVINVVFATILFNLPMIWQGPIDLLIMGLYILIMGYLPYVKEHFAAQKYWITLVGYFSIYLSLFIMLYSFVIMIFIDPIVSVNITFIVMSFGLLSGKYVDLNTRYVKIVLATISTVNIGILTARSFSLLPNMLIFGICLGIGFSCGSTLAFQARKYLPSGFSNQIRFIMAIGFGGAVFELLRVVFVLGIWATLGGFLLTSSFISFPLLAYRKHTKILLIIVASSMFFTEMIYGAPFIAQIPQVLVFLDILFTVLLIYIYNAKESEWGLTRYITNDLEIFVILWEIYSGCISTSIVILLSNVPTISGFSLFAFFILFIALFNIMTVKCVERYNLFAKNPHTKHVINIITQAISLILYLDSALLLSLNIPVFGITQFLVENIGYIFAYRIGIFAGFLCVEFGVIDRYTIKLIKEGLRNQITWITYFIVSISVFALLGTNYNNWFFALLIFCIISFGTIPLLQQAYPQIPALKLRTVNVLLSTANVMAIFWSILQVSENWALILAGPFTLNLVIGLGIIYLCMRLKFIDNRLQHWLYLLLSILIACTIEEYTRSWLNGSWLVNMGLFLLCINLLNTFNVAHSKAAYLYWTVLSFSVSTFIFEGINNAISIDLINAIFYFALIWGSFTTFAYYMLADRVWIQFFPSRQLLFGDSDEGKAKKIFIITAIIDIVLISIAITQAWNYILLNYILGQLNSDPLRSFLLSITLIPLLGLLLFSIILRYIEKNRLWFDSDAQVKKFLKIRNTIGLIIYVLIPSFLTLNIHYLVFSLLGLQYGIITDILVFSGIGIACLNLIDLHYLHLVNKNIVSRITTVGILVIGINLGILVMILTNNFLWGCIVFSLFSYLLQFVLPIEQMEKMRYYLNFSLYLEFLLQIGIGLFSFCPWFIALLLLSGVLHFAIELEQRVCLVPPITSYITRIAPWTWLGFAVISSLCLLLGFLPTFTLGNFFGSILLFTAELFYYNRIINTHVPEKIVANRQRLGQIFYLELFIFLMSVLIPASLNITNVSPVELGLFRCLIYTSLVIIGFGIVFLDELFFQFIRKDHIVVFKRIIYYSFFTLLGLDAALLVYLPFELMSPTIHTLGFSLSCLIGTGILFIAIRLYYNNRLFNQIAYLFFATQVVIFAYLIGATTGLITTLIIGILLYPFIFFLEQIERLIRQIIDWLVLFFHHIWQSFVNMVIAIKNWMVRYQRILMLIISSIVGIASGYLSQNIFVGILLFLICIWNYSPERIEGFSTTNFRNKVFYRGAIYFSLMGSFLSYIPLMPWVITLTILLFLGYVIWIVRTSEQLYQLSIYWRFFSALFAIIDFGVMILLIVYM